MYLPLVVYRPHTIINKTSLQYGNIRAKTTNLRQNPLQRYVQRCWLIEIRDNFLIYVHIDVHRQELYVNYELYRMTNQGFSKW